MQQHSHILLSSWVVFVETDNRRKDSGCKWSGYHDGNHIVEGGLIFKQNKMVRARIPTYS